ncbi:MAG: DNA polymerase III subunit alpha [Lachnospiraceae bacterium]|nr:DNA polymerase III subunit alpha [Lachnospiraceae bacterium]
MGFTHLHVHTEYSLLDGSNKIKEYVARVKELGMTHAAITDHGVMYGVIDFYQAAKAAGIVPIIGCEVYVAAHSMLEKSGAGENRYYHLVLLAENNEGYQNLMKIVSAGFIDGYYYKPRVDKELLRRYHKGLIALSACLAGEVQRYLANQDFAAAKRAALEYRDIFGEHNFFLEVQDHGLAIQKIVNRKQKELSEQTGIPLVATNDVHYTYAEDAAAHDVLLCIQTGKKLADENRMRYEGGQYFVKDENQMLDLFPDMQEAVKRTQEIAERCQVEIIFGETKLPAYDVPTGFTAKSYLRKLCEEGLLRRYGGRAEEHRDKLDYELSMIEKMGYIDYFLIVWDFIHYAGEQGIIVGPGRGSAAGSIVSYCLGITDIDPLKYDLIFERFLNPERVTMPDIDIDFCYERRQEVIDYVVRKYGDDRVVQIVTFGTMAARGVLRDVGRVLDLPYGRVDTIAKMIPAELNITIDKALEKNADLKKLVETDAEVAQLIAMSKRLEGLPRHSSIHAAGVVICQQRAVEYVPLSRGADGAVTTQFTMTRLEELGLLKMDFLGLRTLTVIQNAIRNIADSQGVTINLAQLDYDDASVYESLCSGRNDGVFQLESAGMKSFMKELKPGSMEDVIAGISLYRPGPMDFIPRYIQGKNHPEQIRYETPLLEPILAATYGCIVYQEQVMQIVQRLAGYNLGRSDLVRRAMSKKKEDVMVRERQNFVYGNEAESVPGCIARGVPEAVANHIFDEMMDFAKYAFNKSHAAAYAVVAYQTAYLKHYYPVEFMAALITSVIDHSSKVAEYIYVLKTMGIRLLPPDINHGAAAFTVRDGQILYGLASIRGVGKQVVEEIVQARTQGGPFRSLQDLIERIPQKARNKRIIESLIHAGALDCLPGNRRQKLVVYEQVIAAVTEGQKQTMSGQLNLFDMLDSNEQAKREIHFPPVADLPKGERLAAEKEVLGIYVSGHPLDDVLTLWEKTVTKHSADFVLAEEMTIYDRESVVIGGLVTTVTVKYTRNNQKMAFLQLEDLVGSVEVIVFPKIMEQYADLLAADEKLFIVGQVSLEEDRDSKLIADKIYRFEDMPKELWLRFTDEAHYQRLWPQVQTLLRLAPGSRRVILYLEAEKSMKRLGRFEQVGLTAEQLTALRAVLGEANVVVKEKSIEK